MSIIYFLLSSLYSLPEIVNRHQVLKAVNIKTTVFWDERLPDYTGHVPEYRNA
jgi:hypothetical protein